jgi:hypothetical protein
VETTASDTPKPIEIGIEERENAAGSRYSTLYYECKVEGTATDGEPVLLTMVRYHSNLPRAVESLRAFAAHLRERMGGDVNVTISEDLPDVDTSPATHGVWGALSLAGVIVGLLAALVAVGAYMVREPGYGLTAAFVAAGSLAVAVIAWFKGRG